MKYIGFDTKEIKFLLSFFYFHNKGDFFGKDKKTVDGLIKKFEKSNKRITVKSAKAKGRGLQKWICGQLSALTGILYNQADDQCEIHSREMGQKGCDIILRGEAKKLVPFSIESKNSESFNIRSAIEQARNNKEEGVDWLIVYKNKSMPSPIVIMDWSCFCKMISDRIKNVRYLWGK